MVTIAFSPPILFSFDDEWGAFSPPGESRNCGCRLRSASGKDTRRPLQPPCPPADPPIVEPPLGGHLAAVSDLLEARGPVLEVPTAGHLEELLVGNREELRVGVLLLDLTSVGDERVDALLQVGGHHALDELGGELGVPDELEEELVPGAALQELRPDLGALGEDLVVDQLADGHLQQLPEEPPELGGLLRLD